MTNDQLDRLKRMAVNAGAQVWEDCLNDGDDELRFVNDGALARFARAVAEDCAKVADDSPDFYIADRIRNLYKDQ